MLASPLTFTLICKETIHMRPITYILSGSLHATLKCKNTVTRKAVGILWVGGHTARKKPNWHENNVIILCGKIQTKTSQYLCVSVCVCVHATTISTKKSTKCHHVHSHSLVLKATMFFFFDLVVCFSLAGVALTHQ